MLAAERNVSRKRNVGSAPVGSRLRTQGNCRWFRRVGSQQVGEEGRGVKNGSISKIGHKEQVSVSSGQAADKFLDPSGSADEEEELTGFWGTQQHPLSPHSWKCKSSPFFFVSFWKLKKKLFCVKKIIWKFLWL